MDVSARTEGVLATLIDFTASRLQTPGGDVAFCDLSADPELFQGPKGNCQADTYRRMLKLTRGDWAAPSPATNTLWLHYMADIILTAKPTAVSFPAANGRHEHEWKIWKEVKLPPGKVIIPGMIDSTVNTVEHPELVADRLLNFASAVGRESVIGGVDCGFGTFAGRVQVDTKIVWMKLKSLAEGAAIASKQLWKKAA